MLTPVYTKKFEKDLARAKKRGNDLGKSKEVLRVLINQENLNPRYRNHKLRGNYQYRWECHIEPDWLLIYKIEGDRIFFERTGTYADLFAL
jgi:mRNA interferase YafQ